jgi:hypothetical protein
MHQFLTVSLRQKAIFVPAGVLDTEDRALTETTGLLAANLSKMGFGLSQPLLLALNKTTPVYQARVLETIQQVMGIDKNWTPLVKGWNAPTGESVVDHIITFFGNIFNAKGTRLPCGHTIPAGTFPLERYNGCPFCGTPFEFGAIEQYKQGSGQKVLELWTETDAAQFLHDLLLSKTALDATQMDSLRLLLAILPLPEGKIAMKETLMAVIDLYVSQGKSEQAQALFTTPTDILRYLWYRHTGFLQLVEPSTIIRRKAKNQQHINTALDNSVGAAVLAGETLKLKYSRKECAMVAAWLNHLPMDTAKMCEAMHPKRGMWVRFIRALRLAEYSKKAGFEKLRSLLDKFYKQEYEVWQATVNAYRLRQDAATTLALLQQRPGLFARSLFANMLWFGSTPVVEAFAGIIDKLPARLVFTLYMYAENYFDKSNGRLVKPLGGSSKQVPANRLLSLYNDEQLDEMKSAVAGLCMLAVKRRFAAVATSARTMYIHPQLFKIPLSIGDRSETLQDLPAALMGTRFAVQGDAVRLFMQWGKGMPAQHLDMDLSCMIAYPAGKSDHCAFSRLVTTGCKHSGDIRAIPDKIGTAEYIDLDIAVLEQAGARYVSFTSNAYSNGSIVPNLVVGWMNSLYPMHISPTSGVAYDPSCVQQQLRVVKSLAKGLLFGVLDIAAREIIWMEMEFSGQLVQDLHLSNVETLLKKLNAKMSIGRLLQVKADAQQLQILEMPAGADEVYTVEWALSTAAVTKLLID